MKIKTGDKVIVIAGKDKGKTGEVRRAYPKMGKVLVDKVNVHTKFVKKGAGRPGQQVKIESPILACKLMLLDPQDGKPTRVGYSKDKDGKKYRVSKRTGEGVEKAFVKKAATKKKALDESAPKKEAKSKK